MFAPHHADDPVRLLPLGAMSSWTAKQVLVAARGADGDAAARLLTAAGARVSRSAGWDAVDGVDAVVVDEWTPETAPVVVQARAGGARVTVLAELLLERAVVPVLAVTGTAGKSTTARVAAAILARCGPVTVTPKGRAGNAWPDAELADARPTDGWWVAELTSTHLCHMDLWRGPEVGVVTNLWPDHLELHGGWERYAAAKRRLVERTRTTLVVNADDAGALALRARASAPTRIEYSLRQPVDHGLWVREDRLIVRDDGGEGVLGDWQPPGWAHPASALAGCAAALAAGVDPDAIITGLAGCAPLPHRRRAFTVAGRQIVDDSLATAPAKAGAALEQVTGGVVLIAGGLAAMGGRPVLATRVEADELERVCRLARERAHTVVVFGDAGTRLRELVPDAIPVVTLAEAARIALTASNPGDTILVSPMFPVDMVDRSEAGDAKRWGLMAKHVSELRPE